MSKMATNLNLMLMSLIFYSMLFVMSINGKLIGDQNYGNKGYELQNKRDLQNNDLFLCDNGFIRNSDGSPGCTKCSEDSICPLGTTVEFSEQDLNNEAYFDKHTEFMYSWTPKDPDIHAHFILIILVMISFPILFCLHITRLFIGQNKFEQLFSKIDISKITGGSKNGVGGALI